MMQDFLNKQETLDRLQKILSIIFKNNRLKVSRSHLGFCTAVKFFTDKYSRDWNVSHLYYLLEDYFVKEKISYGIGCHTVKGYWSIIELNEQPLQFYAKNKLEALMLAAEELIKYLGASK